MKKTGLLFLIFTCLLAAGCGQQKDDEAGIQNLIKNMADDSSIQRKFSEGRINAIKKSQKSKQDILQNTLEEQEMMLTDKELRQQLLRFNVKVNQLMTNSPFGKEQLMQSTLDVINGIGKDPNKSMQFVKLQNDIRQQAVKDKALKNDILKQNVQEQRLALANPETAKEVKKISLNTSRAIMEDDHLKPEMLKLDIQRFKEISNSPALRTEMAHAMLPLLKDPVVAAELQKMIKLAVEQETKKMQAMMQKQMMRMKQQNQQSPQTDTKYEGSANITRP